MTAAPKPPQPPDLQEVKTPFTPASQPGSADQAFEIWSRFSRFGWDILGIILLVVSLVLLLGLTGITKGEWISPLVFQVRRWLGWGSYLAVLLFGSLGVALIQMHRRPGQQFPLRLILSIESAFFCLLVLFTAVDGGSLERAELAESAGGLIGWGLSAFFIILVGSFWRTVIAATGLLISILTATRAAHGISAWIRSQGEQANPPSPDRASNAVEILPTQPTVETQPPPQGAAKVKTPPKLDPEFRKSFKVAPVDAEKPALQPARNEHLPPLTLLIGDQLVRPDERHINLTAGLIEKTLFEFGVPARVVGFRIGPTVTQFAVEPGFTEHPGADGINQRQKVRVSQISALARDLALALSAERLRIEAPVPGRSYVGIEVPNSRSTVVRLRSILESEAFNKTISPLVIALGRDVSGHAVVADLIRMPHLLIAGTTGSGKSVCIAALTTCLIMNNTPEELKLVMIDPKMVELVRFNGVPHLLGKVETSIERILTVLRWVMSEMDHRYRLLEEARAKDLDNYNNKMRRRKQPLLPRLVVLIDELADLMMTSPDQTEHSLVRLAQMARATGIHLVVATQRPSTDVVTGLIKANFPARISFTVASSVDSRVILDTSGAETLLGRGDMLFLNPESGTPLRAQGVMVTDQELERIIAHWQKNWTQPKTDFAPWEALMGQEEDEDTGLIEKAVTIVRQEQRASASLLQRRLHIGYPRAARLVDQLEDMGVVGPSQGGGRERQVLINEADDENPDQENDD